MVEEFYVLFICYNGLISWCFQDQTRDQCHITTSSKFRFKIMNGVQGSTIEGHLKEFEWRQRHQGTAFTSLMEQIADRYIVN